MIESVEEISFNADCLFRLMVRLYPEPQKATAVKPWMNVYQKTRRVIPKATGVNPWFGVYSPSTPSGVEGLIS